MTTTITKRAQTIVNRHAAAIRRNPAAFYASSIDARDHNGRLAMFAFTAASFEAHEFQSSVWAEVANIVHETFLRSA